MHLPPTPTARSVATAAPRSGGARTLANPPTENYAYDSADRLTNSGYTYDIQGDITATPSVDSGGSGTLNATYYANDRSRSCHVWALGVLTAILGALSLGAAAVWKPQSFSALL